MVALMACAVSGAGIVPGSRPLDGRLEDGGLVVCAGRIRPVCTRLLMIGASPCTERPRGSMGARSRGERVHREERGEPGVSPKSYSNLRW